ncbi:flagellar hook-basal body protein [Thermaerobacter sp. PB12/4term]|nr:flagellar hook-basal body protein [Thermaerobacter sp. PB12/4term]
MPQDGLPAGRGDLGVWRGGRGDPVLRGLYTAASGMLARVLQQERLAGDLANVNTPGYKASRNVTEAFPELLLSRLDGTGAPVVGPLGTGTVVAEPGADMRPGPWVTTGRPQDLALEGDGFFVVMGPGGPAYTRAGNFTVGPEGYLQAPDGSPVLDTTGQPLLVGSAQFTVRPDGQVVGGDAVLGTIARVTFANPAGLRRVGDNLWQATPESGPAVPAATPVRQGVLEQSNVDPVQVVVAMLANFRAFEAAQRAVQAQDQTLGLAIQEVGRVT